MPTIEVGGMHCQNCANSVTTALSALPGLSNVSILPSTIIDTR